MSTLVSVPCHPGPSEPVYEGLLTRCAACGLVRTAGPLRIAYEAAYFTAEGTGGYDFEGAFARARDDARFGAELDRLEGLGLRGSVLDVGCATGAFLARAKARGWTVAGAEVAAYARAAAAARLGVAIPASLADLPAGARYDVVTLHHVLEHVADPGPFLRDEILPRVRRRLLVEVPNFDALAARRHGPRWRDLRPDQHLFHFTRRTLPPLLRRAGFEPVAAYTLWEPLWSLRTALDVLAQLPALAAAVSGRRPAAAGGRETAAVQDVSGWSPPRGARRAAVALSRAAFRPLVWAQERAGLGERLVVEAVPAGERAP
jgi:SAM-dependent methyltransferase